MSFYREGTKEPQILFSLCTSPLGRKKKTIPEKVRRVEKGAKEKKRKGYEKNMKERNRH